MTPTKHLTPHERELILDQLRDEAITSCRALGCTCEPTMTQTTQTFGPYALPCWISEHADGCGVELGVAAIR